MQNTYGFSSRQEHQPPHGLATNHDTRLEEKANEQRTRAFREDVFFSSADEQAKYLGRREQPRYESESEPFSHMSTVLPSSMSRVASSSLSPGVMRASTRKCFTALRFSSRRSIDSRTRRADRVRHPAESINSPSSSNSKVTW